MGDGFTRHAKKLKSPIVVMIAIVVFSAISCCGIFAYILSQAHQSQNNIIANIIIYCFRLFQSLNAGNKFITIVFNPFSC
jgi:flagellar basal body-associated protein FliL